MLSSVDLPEPDRPKQHDQLAREQLEIDARQGMNLDLTQAVGLGEPSWLRRRLLPCDPPTLRKRLLTSRDEGRGSL